MLNTLRKSDRYWVKQGSGWGVSCEIPHPGKVLGFLSLRRVPTGWKKKIIREQRRLPGSCRRLEQAFQQFHYSGSAVPHQDRCGFARRQRRHCSSNHYGSQLYRWFCPRSENHWSLLSSRWNHSAQLQAPKEQCSCLGYLAPTSQSCRYHGSGRHRNQLRLPGP